MIHIRYLADIPFAHVPIKHLGINKHCEEREKPHVRISRINGKSNDETVRTPPHIAYLGDGPFAHVAVEIVGAFKH